MRCCRAEALYRVHRTLGQKIIFSRIYKCHVCGRYEYVLRFLPSLPSWTGNYWKLARRGTRIISNPARRNADSLNPRENS